jgi:hypothetical protein
LGNSSGFFDAAFSFRLVSIFLITT